MPTAPLVGGWRRRHRESSSSCTATSQVTRQLRVKARSDEGAWNALPDSGTDPGWLWIFRCGRPPRVVRHGPSG
jgi:hypothetical protein